MQNILSSIQSAVSHFLFPHNCLGCSIDILRDDDLLCSKCMTQLPYTHFTNAVNNPIEKVFYGRLNAEQATSLVYYSKDSLVQFLLAQLKYKGNKEVGLYFGKLLGFALQQSSRFNTIDALIALPLNEKKEFKRGYNQAMLICQGIASVLNKPILKNAVVRTVFTETQTHENRINRFQNMDGVFKVSTPSAIENKHILLVDDVITTGATLEACGMEILKQQNTKLSFATIACSINQ